MSDNPYISKKGKLIRKFIAVFIVMTLMVAYFPFDAVPTNTVYASDILTLSGSTYIVDDEDDLFELATNKNYRGTKATFTQTKDITLSKPWTTPIHDFQGTYNGNGYKIKNFTGTINQQDISTSTGNYYKYFGLFGQLKDASVENVRIEIGDAGFNVNLEYNPEVVRYSTAGNMSCVGVLSGACDSTSRIINCSVTGGAFNVKSSLDYPMVHVGTFAGAIGDNSQINGCYTNIRIHPYFDSDNNYKSNPEDRDTVCYETLFYISCGGIVGQQMNGCTISNSVFNGEMKVDSAPGKPDILYLSGISGISRGSNSILNCFADMKNTDKGIFNKFDTINNRFKLIVSSVTTLIENASTVFSNVYYDPIDFPKDSQELFVPSEHSFFHGVTNYAIIYYLKRNNTVTVMSTQIIESFLHYHYFYNGNYYDGDYFYERSYLPYSSETGLINGGNNSGTKDHLGKKMDYFSAYGICPKWMTDIPKPTANPVGGSLANDAVILSTNSKITISNNASIADYNLWYKFSYATKATVACPELSPIPSKRDAKYNNQDVKAYEITANQSVLFNLPVGAKVTYKINDSSVDTYSSSGISLEDAFKTKEVVKVTLTIKVDGYADGQYDYYFARKRLLAPIASPGQINTVINVQANQEISLTYPSDLPKNTNFYYSTSSDVNSDINTIYNADTKIKITNTSQVTTLRVQAKDSSSNYAPSEVVTYKFKVEQQRISKPTIAIESTDDNNGTVKIKITCDTAGAQIKYSTDGTEPPNTFYNSSFNVNNGCTVKAIATVTSSSGNAVSEIAKLDITRADKPSITFNMATNKFSISSTNTNAELHYILNNWQDKIYTSEVELTQADTIKAYAIDGSKNIKKSEIVSKTINKLPEILATCDGEKINLSCGDNQTIFTSNGETTSTSFVGQKDTNYQIKAMHIDYISSSKTVSFSQYNTTPTITFNQATNTVTISKSYGENVLYSTNGDYPNISYTGPFTITSSCTVKAIVTKQNYFYSEASSQICNYTEPAHAAPIAAQRITSIMNSPGMPSDVEQQIEDTQTELSETQTLPQEDSAQPQENSTQSQEAQNVTQGPAASNDSIVSATITRDFKAAPVNGQWTKVEDSSSTIIDIPTDAKELQLATLEIQLVSKDAASQPPVADEDHPPIAKVIYYYKFKNACATPIITPNGANSKIDMTKGIQISCSTPNAKIYYTTTGADPTLQASKAIEYTGQPIIFPDNLVAMTVKAYAKVESSDPNTRIDNSEIAEVTYTKNNRESITKPNLLMGDDKLPFDSNTYYEPGTAIYFSHNNINDENFRIIYNVNQSTDPTTGGFTYNAESPYKIPANTSGTITINAVAQHNLYSDSEVATFTINVKSNGKVPVPSIPNGSTVSNGTELSLSLDESCIPADMKATNGKINTSNTSFTYKVPEIWYMIGDGDPVTEGQIYVQPTPEINITDGDSTTTIPKREEQRITLSGTPGETITLSVAMNGADTNYSSSKVAKLKYTFIGKAEAPTATPTTAEDNVATILKGSKIYLMTQTAGASIYYTVDGSAPVVTATGIGPKTKLYDADKGIEVPTNSSGFFTVMALSAKFKDTTNTEFALENSSIATFTYQFPAAVQAPFSIPAQGTVVNGQQIKLKTSTKDAQIFYEIGTNSGSVNTPDPMKSAMYDEQNPIIITKNTVIKAVAYKDQVLSEVVTYTFTLASNVEPVTSSVSSGSVVAKGSILKLSSKTQGADIIYTLDGSDPKKDGNQSAITGKEILVSDKLGETMTVRAYAKKDGMTSSDVVTFSFIVNSENGGITAYPATGTLIAQNTAITLTTSISNAKLYYTTDGSVPTSNSSSGTKVIATGNPGETITIKAIALTENSTVSPVATFTYTFQKRTPTPTASLPNNSILKDGAKVSLYAAENAIIYYTTDGTEPNTSSNQYVSQISIDNSMVIKAIAVNSGYEVSEVAQFTYTLADACLSPVASVASGKLDINTKVSLSCGTEGATIYYTTNGTEPDANDLKNMLMYSSPITVSRNVTIKMIAIKEGFQPSAVNTEIYTVNEPVVIVEDDDNTLENQGGTRLASRRNFSQAVTGPTFTDILITDKQYNAIISAAENAIPKNTLLKVKSILIGEADRKAVKTVLGENYDISSSYDISLSSNGENIQPSGQIEIGLPIEGESVNSIIQVCRLNDDGTVTTFQTRRDGNTAYFMADHLSRYAVVVATPSSSQSRGISIAIITILGSIICACGFGLYVLLQKSGKRSIDRHINR